VGQDGADPLVPHDGRTCAADLRDAPCHIRLARSALPGRQIEMQAELVEECAKIALLLLMSEGRS